MSFLLFEPTVFVVCDRYEVLVFARENGLIRLEIDGAVYDAENTGVLATERNYAKIPVPQSVLDQACSYRVIYQKSILRQPYRSELGQVESRDFSFLPIDKTEGIRIYNISDIHYRFELAEKTVSFFGELPDLLVMNGDFGESDSDDFFLRAGSFFAHVAKGRIPVIYVRGNHDTRGKTAEKFGRYFPVENGKTYYPYRVGPISGLVLDCGEDKPDCHPEYNGVNDFEGYRRRELDFLKQVKVEQAPYMLAFSHICPIHAPKNKGDCFDIEHEVYTAWNTCIEEKGIDLMLCGHIHRRMILEPHDPKSVLDHNYPVIMATALEENDIIGTALTLYPGRAECAFTDASHTVRESFTISLGQGD